MYKFKCNKFEFIADARAKKAIEAVIYWAYCKLRATTDHERDEANKSLCDWMQEMERYNIPNWLGNSAISWADNLKDHYLNDFFRCSIYVVK